MNIFYLDKDPIIAAQMQCDKHVVKMSTETAQLLCTVINICSKGDIQSPYHSTHINHPCTKWAGLTPENFNWLYKHGIALCKEYTFRYGRRHKCENIIEWCKKNQVTNLLSGFTDPPQVMPSQYKRKDSTVYAYRDVYWLHKRHTMVMRWTKRPKPEWWLALEILDETICRH